MINQNFGILAALLALLGSAIYAWSTLKGKVMPNRVTWLLWAIAPGIAFAAELAAHTTLRVTLLTLAEGFGPLLVITASFLNSRAYWKLTRFDAFCGAIAVVALILWVVTGDGTIAIAFSILSSLFASLPTIVKSYAHPSTESPVDYVASSAAGLITLLTIRHWTLANYGFPVYVLVTSLLLSLLLLVPRGQKEEAGKTYEDFLNLGEPSFSVNPIVQGANTTLSVPVTSGLEPAGGEYYIGEIDPGPGNGISMSCTNNQLSATLGASLSPGTYNINIRVHDTSGSWSKLRSTGLGVIALTNYSRPAS